MEIKADKSESGGSIAIGYNSGLGFKPAPRCEWSLVSGHSRKLILSIQ